MNETGYLSNAIMLQQAGHCSMMGLLLYGVMKGHSSFRALEHLARLDLGCIFVSHGVAPDHARIPNMTLLYIGSVQARLEDIFSVPSCPSSYRKYI